VSVALTVQVEFADQVIAALEEALPDALDERVPLAMQGVGLQMQFDAQLRAPKRTGYMASQITFEILSTGKWAFRLIGRAPYTFYQEFGTRRIAPHLFMTQALQIYQGQMVDAVAWAVEDAIRDAFG
jgi:hypothetical protein